MFEKEQIQIKPWRETCDRAGRGRAGIADKEQEGRGEKNGRRGDGRESEVSHGHRWRVPWVVFLVPLWFLSGSSGSSGMLGVCASGAEQRGAWQNRGMGIVETREVDQPGRGRGMGHEAWVGKGKRK